MRKNTMDVFWSRVQKAGDNECWIWTGLMDGDYGRFRLVGKMCSAHRLSYETLVGPIPKGMVIDHLCRNTRCVNPKHLEVVDDATNVMRGYGMMAENSRKTHCKRGHPLTPDNLSERHLKIGKRGCKICDQAYHNRRKITKEQYLSVRMEQDNQ